VGFTPGTADQDSYTGYGVGPYGSGLYSVPQSYVGGIPTPAASWSLDAWGEYLVAQFCGSGKIYEWQLNTGTPAAEIGNSPTGNETIIVTDERILLAFGAGGNPRAIQGSDSEDNTDWTPSISNQSINRQLHSDTKIVTADMFRGDVMVWTDDSLFRGVYVRPPFVYEWQEVGQGCSIAGRNATAALDKRCLWFGQQSFWQWDGGSVGVLDCPLLDELTTDLNYNQITKVYAVVNSTFGEVTWLYPSGDSTECDSYITYSYTEDHWTRGTIDRLVGVDSSVFPAPLMLDSTGLLYEHEIEGGAYGGDSPFLESGPVEVGQSGEKLWTIHQLIPDDTDPNEALDAAADISIYLKAQMYPASSIRQVGPLSNTRPTGTRVTGRQIAMRLEGGQGRWRIGDYRVLFSQRGKR
jgi:hypothetical protein